VRASCPWATGSVPMPAVDGAHSLGCHCACGGRGTAQLASRRAGGRGAAKLTAEDALCSSEFEGCGAAAPGGGPRGGAEDRAEAARQALVRGSRAGPCSPCRARHLSSLGAGGRPCPHACRPGGGAQSGVAVWGLKQGREEEADRRRPDGGRTEHRRRRRDWERRWARGRTQGRRKKNGTHSWQPKYRPTKLRGRGEKFGRSIKITAHLLSLLEIKFLYQPNKYGDRSPFSHPAGLAVTDHFIR